MAGKSVLQSIWDFIGIPFRLLLFDQKWLSRFGWTTLEEERIAAVLPFLKGKILDIGAGENRLVKQWGQGIGVDVFDWGGGALMVEDSAQLPFSEGSFDTITFLACLNHIPNRQEVLNEAHRLLCPGGSLVITMINPVLGNIGHALWWYSEDKIRGGMQEGELGGLWSRQVIDMCNKAGFVLSRRKKFVYRMNNLYVFTKVE
jgi:SAM-dependent methyltransferase